jgi:hypothetical protein
LAQKVWSKLIFAHVRAAYPGMMVSEGIISFTQANSHKFKANCHPFQSGRYLWMHNGTLSSVLHLHLLQILFLITSFGFIIISFRFIVFFSFSLSPPHHHFVIITFFSFMII